MKRYRIVRNSCGVGISEMEAMIGRVFSFEEVAIYNNCYEIGGFTWPFEDIELIEGKEVTPEEEPTFEDYLVYREMERAFREGSPTPSILDKGVSEPYTAEGFLERAIELFTERAKDYDTQQERSMGKAVKAFNAITGCSLTEPEGWLLLQILKDVRQWTKPSFHRDSAEDCIAYAALKAEALVQEDKK